MVQRHHRSGFMPQAWVFPGGRVDPTDALCDHPSVTGAGPLAERLGMSVDRAAGFGVAAIRETLEESGIWLGRGEPDDTCRSALHIGERTMAQVLDDGAGPVDLDLLVPWAWWITPVVEKRRFDTLFFAVSAQQAEGRHDAIETVDSRWVAPREAIAAPMLELPLAPPTWWTLVQLAQLDSVSDALAGAPWVGRPVQPVVRFPEASIELLLPGHPEHPDQAIEGYPDRLSYGATWIAWRAGARL